MIFAHFLLKLLNSLSVFPIILTKKLYRIKSIKKGIPNFNNRDIIDYYYVYQMSPEVTQIMISEKTLAKLSPEDQKTIVDICRQECANSVNYAKEEDEKYLKLMEDNDIKIVRFSDEEIEMFAEAVRTDVWPKLAKTYGEDFINELLKLYK